MQQQLAALAVALPADASQAQRRAIVRAAIVNAPASREEASEAQIRNCLRLVVATIHADQAGTGTETSDLTAAALEQLMHAACAVELLHHAGGIAGGFSASVCTGAAQALDRLLLPLLSAPSSALMTEARRTELASEAANLLVALHMHYVAYEFVEAFKQLIRRGASCSSPTAAGGIPQDTPAAGTAVDSADLAACAAAAAAAGCWSAAQQLQRQLTQQEQQQVMAECPQLSSLAEHRPQPVPPSAALLLLCQLSEATVAAVVAEDAQWHNAPTSSNREPSKNMALALRAASKSVKAVAWLLSAPQLEASRQPLDPAAAAQSLMAVALRAAGNPRKNLEESTLEALFGMCTDADLDSDAERRIALACLVSLVPRLTTLESPGGILVGGAAAAAAALDSGSHVAAGGPQAGNVPAASEYLDQFQEEGTPCGQDARFLRLMCSAMACDDPLDRKRAVYLLRSLGTADAAPSLGMLLQMYESLDEFSLHAVEATWGNIEQLHPAPAPGSLVAEPDLPFEWMAVLWRHGLVHTANPSVQQLVLGTFLRRDWRSAEYLADVPTAFVADALVPAAQAWVAHKGKLDGRLLEALTTFLRQHAAAVQPQRRRELARLLLAPLAARHTSQAAHQLQLACVLAAVSPPRSQVVDPPSEYPPAGDASDSAWVGEVLRLLLNAVDHLPGGRGTRYSLNALQGLLQAAAALVPDALQHSTSEIAALLAAAPLSELAAGRQLHGVVTGWLVPEGDNTASSRAAAGVQALLLQLLSSVIDDHGVSGSIGNGGTNSPSGNVAASHGATAAEKHPVSPREIAALQKAADRCAALALACSGSRGAAPAAWEATLQLLENQASGLWRRRYAHHGWREATLALLTAFLRSATVGSGWLQQRMAQLLARQQSELTVALPATAAVLSWSSGAVFSVATAPQQGPAPPREYGAAASQLLPGPAAAVALATLALECLALALEVLQDCMGGVKGSTAALTEFESCGFAWLSEFTCDPTPAEGGIEAEVTAAALAAAAPLVTSLSTLGTLWGSCSPKRLIDLALTAAERAQAALLEAKWAFLAAVIAATADAAPHNEASRPTACGQQDQQAEQPAPRRPRPHEVTKGEMALDGVTAAALLATAAAEADSAQPAALLDLLSCVRVCLAVLVAKAAAASTQQAAAAAATIGTHSLGRVANGADHVDGGGFCAAVWLAASPCWRALEDATDRRAETAFAFCSAFLQPALLSAQLPANLISLLHGEDGPIRWVCRQLLAAGERSLRLRAAAAAPLAAAWSASPTLAGMYLPEMQALLLDGQLEAVPTAEADLLADAVPGAADYRAAVDRLGQPAAEALQATQLAPRVMALCAAHSLVVSSSITAGAVAMQLWQQLMHLAQHDKELSSPKYRLGSAAHRRKIRLWQALCILPLAVLPEERGATLEQLHTILEANDVGDVKQYQEAAALQLLLADPALAQPFLVPKLTRYAAKSVEAIPSLALLAAQFLLHAPSDVSAPLRLPLVAALAPWAMTHQHAARAMAVMVLEALAEAFPDTFADSGIGSAVAAFVAQAPDVQRLKAAMGPGLRGVDPARAVTPQGVLHAGTSLAGGCSDVGNKQTVSLEGAPVSLVATVEQYLIQERAWLRQQREAAEAAAQAAEAVAALGMARNRTAGVPQGANHQRKAMPAARAALIAGIAGPSAPAGGSSPVAELERLGLLASGAEQAAELDGALRGALEGGSSGSGRRHPLVLVASLVDKVPNLAGLTRTCEVFGAAELVVADTRVTAAREFRQISMTAEQWLPMRQVPVPSLMTHLCKLRAAGYTLVGLEQTTDSTPLPEYRFPAKTALLLGREREGIPPDILGILDATVEIPQHGVIRSLNVHVAASTAVYEYVRQHQKAAE